MISGLLSSCFTVARYQVILSRGTLERTAGSPVLGARFLARCGDLVGELNIARKRVDGFVRVLRVRRNGASSARRDNDDSAWQVGRALSQFRRRCGGSLFRQLAGKPSRNLVFCWYVRAAPFAFLLVCIRLSLVPPCAQFRTGIRPCHHFADDRMPGGGIPRGVSMTEERMVSLPETLLLLAAVFYILASVFTALGLRR